MLTIHPQFITGKSGRKISVIIPKVLRLFEDDQIINDYRYSCYVTSLTLPSAEVSRLYRGRANCENQIKELKYDYTADKINQQGFDST